MLVDVVVSTKNNPTGLAQLLSHLPFQTHKNLRLVLNDESDVSVLSHPTIVRTIDLLALHDIHMVYNRNLESKGTPWSTHVAFSLATADYLWSLDDDAIPDPTALERLLEAIEEKDCGYVQGCTGDISNSRGHANYVAKPLSLPNDPNFPLYYYYRYNGDRTRPIAHGEGCNVLFNREKLKSIKNNYFNKDFILEYGNNSGIHVAITFMLGLEHTGYIRTGSVAYHLDRINPRFDFKTKRNQIIANKVRPHVSHLDYQGFVATLKINDL